MTRMKQNKISSGKRILLVDNQEDYRGAVQSLLSKEGHEVITISEGNKALDLLRKEHFDLLLLDYSICGDITSTEVVSRLREFNSYIQVILQTGYSSENPPRDMMKSLDIQGYHDKSDGAEKLLLWVDVGLKASNTIQMLYKSRKGLEYILDVTPELHKIQTLDNLFHGIMLQISGLLGTVNSFLAILPEDQSINITSPVSDAFLAMLEEETILEIRVATGKFSEFRSLEGCLEPPKVKELYDILRKANINFNNEYTVIPLLVGDTVLGIIYLDQCIKNKHDIEILQVFSNQAAVAIQNIRLFSTATIDILTGAYVRSFFEQWLLRELRTSFRQQLPLSLIMLDMDGLKYINDTAGHLAGDQALSIMGSVLKKSTRITDFVGRYGGDEFAILLPNTPIENTHIVLDRIRENLKGKFVEGPSCNFPVNCSMGACGMEIQNIYDSGFYSPISQSYFNEMAKQLIGATDQLLYRAKQNGRACHVIGNSIKWQPIIE
ncbi:UNVERIFIED_CONTAM: diguanylate cyclase (GGDEF)-like protein [Acetivibrio alkalicellulosi]